MGRAGLLDELEERNDHVAHGGLLVTGDAIERDLAACISVRANPRENH